MQSRRSKYVELHLHTAYSFLDGASVPEELIFRAHELGYRALAITDHDGLYGVLEFAQLAKAAGIQPITGAELTLIDGSHITLLVESQTGYRNLCRLLTVAQHTQRTGEAPLLAEAERAAWQEHQNGVPIIHHYPDPESSAWLDPALLGRFSEGLILLTGCRQSRLVRLVDAGRMAEAERLLQQYIEWFGPANVFVELQHNYLPADDLRLPRLVGIARRAGLRYVATGNVHYHRRERHQLQDVLVAIRHRTTLDGCHQQRRGNSEFHLPSDAEMRHRFATYPEAIDATLAIADRCRGFDATADLGYVFPDYPGLTAGETPDDGLRRLCAGPFGVRYPPGSPRHQEATARLAEELRLIKQHKLAGFFLIHRDLLELAREVAIEVRGTDTYRAQAMLPPGRGRGSSVSSIVCYLIGLSPVDPLEHGLSVGRFLNDGSSAVPDIDLDFPRDIREKLLARIHEDYGDRAAMVSAFATYKLRSATRDIGKALGISESDLDYIAKGAEPHSAAELGRELDRMPSFAQRKAEPPWCYLVELAEQLAGHPRHITQHSGGMIIGSGPITEMVPVQPAAMDGRFLCQWDKDSCSDAGFVKIDFLGLGMLSAVEECMELIGRSGNPVPDLSRINYSDEEIYRMIRAGDTLGTFQIESRAQIQTTLRTEPSCLADIVVQVAIVRPGPVVGGATTPYIQRRRDPNWQPTYDHPLLEPVLRDTLGVIVFQDQILEVAQALAGFTAGQADSLRRAMSRRRSLEAMDRHHDDFVRGAMERGVPQNVAESVFTKLRAFSSYGFPRGHAASFGVLAYQTCYLKRYYPAEFLCSVLNNQPMGFYPPHVLGHEGKRRGIQFRSPTINGSGTRSTVPQSGTIQIGLSQVKGLSEEDAERIVAEREAKGRYRSLADFVRRVALSGELTERLIQIGAFAEFGLSLRESLWQLGLFTDPRRFGTERGTTKRPRKKNRVAGIQQPLPLPVEQDMIALPPTTATDRMHTDYEVLGLSVRFHPLGLLRPRLPPGVITAAELLGLSDGARVRMAGMTVVRQRPETAKGVTFLLIEDETGLSNVIVYPALYEAQRSVVRGESMVMVTGRVQQQANTINVVAERVEPLARYLEPGGAGDLMSLKPVEELTPSTHNYR